MDLFDELDFLAVSAAYEEVSEENVHCYDPAQGTVKKCQERLGYTYNQAAELFQLTKSVKNQHPFGQQVIISPAQARTVYALKLVGLTPTPQKVQIAANLLTAPESYHGSGEEGDTLFCKVDGQTKKAIEKWLSTQKTNFRPLFVPEGRACKELSPDSLYPTLGKDVTLPQCRPQDSHLLDKPASFGRAQGQFPVWHFFYGTLDDVSKLRSLLPLPASEIPILYDATVAGGKMGKWGKGKYNALVDGPETSCIKGSAYQILSEDEEDALRRYETSAYEVVRCLIEMDGSLVEGCTFRFVGEID